MAIGVPFGKQRVVNHIFDRAERLVVALALFILDNTALVIELFLRHRAKEMAHAVAFEPEHPVKRPCRHRLKIIGPVKPCRPIIIGRADLLERLEEITRRVFGAIEHQMFEQMRKTRLALGLVLRPDMIPDRNRNHRCLAVGMDEHAQAVSERERFIGDVHLRDEIGNGCRLGSKDRRSKEQRQSKQRNATHRISSN